MMRGRTEDGITGQHQILSSLRHGNDTEKLSKDLLAMSSSPANYSRMRTIPVISSMVQLLHQPNHNKSDPAAANLSHLDTFRNPQSRDVRARIARALHNTVQINQLSKNNKREGKVLRLLENLRMYSDVLRDLNVSLKDLNKGQDDRKESELPTTLEEKE